MNMKHFHLLPFLFLTVFVCNIPGVSQTLARNSKIYKDYPRENKQLILDEQFNSNEGRWPTSSNIIDGILTLNEDQGETFKRTPEIFTTVSADLSRDFEIETSLLYFKNSMIGGYGISWDNFLWQFSKGDFFNVNKYDNRWKYLIN